MRVRVLFFGVLKDLLGRASEELSLPATATLGDVLQHYEAEAPRLREYAASLALSVNQEYAPASVRLRDGDEVALLPPVSGGKDANPTLQPQEARLQDGAPEVFVRIVHSRIVPHDIVPGLERPEDGAIAMFDGIVRNHSRGRQTLFLEYEAYEEMALKQMQALAEEALSKFQIRNVALVHRLGRLEIGESSVFIAVFSAHRAAAFDACRWLIDTLKKQVPIWKKEHFADGVVWADGEPFPAEFAAAANGLKTVGDAEDGGK